MKSTVPFPGGKPYPRSLHLWRPAGVPRALMLVSHGMAEHIGRYDALGRALSAAGFLMAGFNQLGHGAEAPIKGWNSDQGGWDLLVDDLRLAFDWLAEDTPGARLVLLGHSAGSFLAREFAIRYPNRLDALVLSATGWYPRALCAAGLLISGAQCLLGGARKPSHLLDRMNFNANNKPFRREGGSAFDWLSRDAEEVALYVNDPLCGFPYTAGGYRDLFTGLMALTDTARLKALRADLPVYLMSGTKDVVGGFGAGVRDVAGQYRLAGLTRVTEALYEGARHELFHETNREQAISGLIAWLEGLFA